MDIKSNKWIVIGSIVFIIALLVAVGPLLVTKYMRAKWQNVPKHSTSYLLIKVEGKLLLSKDNIPYLLGNNNLYYLLENLKKEDIDNYLNKNCFVLGKIIEPNEKNNKIDGNDVRMIISIDKIADYNFSNKDEELEKNISKQIKEKTAKKNKLRIETNVALNKPILFDVIKGKLSLQIRKTKTDKDISVLILTDEFGDTYLLQMKNKLITNILSTEEVICLGREVMPLQKMALVVDEINFEIYELYDTKFNRLM